MNKENVLSMFLRIVTEYDYLDFTEEELAADFEEIMSMAIVELQMQGLLLDIDSEEFVSNRSIEYIVAHASVLIWLEPKVNSAEMLAAQLTSTDFTQFSNANRLQACIKLYNQCEAKLNNLILDYDRTANITEIREELE
jgi:hypothetical protein